MKLSRQPCRIVGVRVGEIAVNLLSPSNPSVSVKFVLLSDPAKSDTMNSGSFTKTQWGPATVDAMLKLIDSMETDALQDLFDEEAQSTNSQVNSGLSFPPVPTLGGPKM